MALLSEDATRANEPLKLLRAGALENQWTGIGFGQLATAVDCYNYDRFFPNHCDYHEQCRRSVDLLIC